MPEYYSSICEEFFDGTYTNGMCEIEVKMGVEFDGNTVTLTEVQVDKEDPDFSYCTIIVLTKQ